MRDDESFLLVVKAVCRRQDPTGVNEDSSTFVKVFLVSGPVDINDRLPRLLGDVTLWAPKYAERGPTQGIVYPLTTGCYREETMVQLLVMVSKHQTPQRKRK